MKKHRTRKVDNFKSNIKSKYERDSREGYCVITNDIPTSHCRKLIDELKSNQLKRGHIEIQI